MMNRRQHKKPLVSAFMSASLILAGCSSSSTTTTDTAQSDSTTPTTESSNTTAEIESPLPDLGGRKITVAVENAYLPFNYVQRETGKPGGWDYDGIPEICKRLNCEAEFVTVAWDGMIDSIASGQYDMAANGITITTEREEIVDFSDGYMAIEQRILVEKDNTDLLTIDDLRADQDKQVGTQTGTTNYDVAVDEVGEDRVEGYDTSGSAVEALINGEVAAVILDGNAGKSYVTKNADKIMLVGDPLASEELGFVFGKESDLVEPFNQAIAEMRKDLTLDKLTAKYFGVEFTLTQDDIE